jgi:hypothetical protein
MAVKSDLSIAVVGSLYKPLQLAVVVLGTKPIAISERLAR